MNKTVLAAAPIGFAKAGCYETKGTAKKPRWQGLRVASRSESDRHQENENVYQATAESLTALLTTQA